MKKNIIILFSMLTLIVGISMATVTGLPNDKEPIKEKDGKLQVQWEFTPEVETRYGYNFDSQSHGFKGSINTDIKLMFLDKDVEFVGEEAASGKGVWGKIKVNDLEVKVDISDKPNDYDSGFVYTKEFKTGEKLDGAGLNINWESITAWVYFGPMFYIKMGDINHHEIRYVDTIRDSDFSVISESIIPPYYTGSYMGRRDTFAQYGETQGPDKVDPIYQRKAKDEQYIKNGNFVGMKGDNLHGFAIGINIPDKITFELGAQTKYTYEQRVMHDYNPFYLSMLVEATPVENLSVKFKTSAMSGNDARNGSRANIDKGIAGITTDNNPLTVGGSVSYSIPVGASLNLVPTFAAEVMFEQRTKINTKSKLVDPFDQKRKEELAKEYILTVPAEVALGLTLNWKSLGRSADEGGHLAMSSQDVKVTDGVSLVALFGEQPYEPIPDIPSMYTGLQLSVWESEAEGKPGIIPNLKAGFITNLNYAFGGVYPAADYAKGSELDYSKYEFTNSPRLDWGIGTELSYKIAQFKPYLGVIFKALDIVGETEIIKVQLPNTPLSEVKGKIEERYASRSDLRLKLGVDFTISKNVTLNAEWKSGDLLYSQSTYKTGHFNTRGYDDYDFFKIQEAKKSRVPSFASEAQTGIVSVGLKVAF